MYMNPQWAERTLVEETQNLLGRIDDMGRPRDRPAKHALSFLKQMVRAKREQLASLKRCAIAD
jgi:hypothetical protein